MGSEQSGYMLNGTSKCCYIFSKVYSECSWKNAPIMTLYSGSPVKMADLFDDAFSIKLAKRIHYSRLVQIVFLSKFFNTK